MNDRITVHLCTKDRHAETFGVLESLRKQSIDNWDLILLDDASGNPVTQAYFIQSIVNRLKLEGHKVKLLRNDFSKGVCAARNRLIDEDDFDNKYTFRCDDDVLLEDDYLEHLMNGINIGYDAMSGVIPMLAHPEWKREYTPKLINEHILDSEGNLLENKDECGFCYVNYQIVPTHQFRTHCLYKSEINKKVRYPDNLTFTGFREEGFFSMGMILAGYTIGVNTGAVAYHLSCPSGGVRVQNYAENVQIDDATFKTWLKKKFEEKGDFLKKYNAKVMKK